MVHSLRYRFDLPSNWWYRHLGAVGPFASKVEIAENEVTDDNIIITIVIVKKDFIEKSDNIHSVVVERDDETNFIVRGPKDLASHIQEIADSLRTF